MHSIIFSFIQTVYKPGRLTRLGPGNFFHGATFRVIAVPLVHWKFWSLLHKPTDHAPGSLEQDKTRRPPEAKVLVPLANIQKAWKTKK